MSATAQMVLWGPQEKAAGVRVLKEVEELAVSKLEASQQSASDASCQAAKQFLHEAPYEQVLPRPHPTGCLAYLYTPSHLYIPSHLYSLSQLSLVLACGFVQTFVTPFSMLRGVCK